MTWLAWILIAFGFMGAELFVPTGFVFLLIGLSFLVSGLLVASGFNEPTWMPWAVCLTCLLTFMSTLRKPLTRWFKLDSPSKYEELTGDEVLVIESIAPGAVGYGEMRGTQWSVKNMGTSALSKGDRCKVIRMSGLTVEVQK